jgi:hypothetical protein
MIVVLFILFICFSNKVKINLFGQNLLIAISSISIFDSDSMQHSIAIKPMIPLETLKKGIWSIPDINSVYITGDFAYGLKVLFLHWGVVVQQVLIFLLKRNQ